ncbi:hypothetical protein NYE39_02205 [Janibacter sp. FSL W8-0316]|uniref:hypothetical protein n=1 Tax=Janibacter sp. FSL W8-0316 TaxID=2975325 RepID=UPI0030F63294
MRASVEYIDLVLAFLSLTASVDPIQSSTNAASVTFASFGGRFFLTRARTSSPFSRASFAVFP